MCSDLCVTEHSGYYVEKRLGEVKTRSQGVRTLDVIQEKYVLAHTRVVVVKWKELIRFWIHSEGKYPPAPLSYLFIPQEKQIEESKMVA